MIVYVETNFVLELAFLQEEHESCDLLVKLAEVGDIQLYLPAFCIGETYEAWVRRSKRRAELHNRLLSETRELSRSKPYQAPSKELQELTNLLVQSSEEEKDRLDQVLTKVLDIVEIIPIDIDVIKSALALQKSRNLSPQDSIVYASLLSQLVKNSSTTEKCLINRNAKDFLTPDILNELVTFHCKLLTSFKDGLGYIQSVV
jgi:predicted nucleic acid-binding protein